MIENTASDEDYVASKIPFNRQKMQIDVGKKRCKCVTKAISFGSITSLGDVCSAKMLEKNHIV